MNRNEYLNILSQRLSVLPVDEYNNTMQYYTEYFEEAGLENEANVIAELGDVHQLAERILQENGQPPQGQKSNQMYIGQQSNEMYMGQQPNQMYMGQQVPVYNQPYIGNYNQSYEEPQSKRSTGMTVFLAIATIPLWIVFVALVFSFGVAAVSVLASSLFTIIAGMCVIFTYFGTGMAFIGSGFIMIAVGMGLLMACKGISQGMKSSFRAIFKCKRTNA